MLFKKLFMSFSLAASLVGSGIASADNHTPSWEWGGRLAVDYGVAASGAKDQGDYGATLSSAELNIDVDFHNSVKFSLGTDFNLDSISSVSVKTAFLTFEDLFSHTDIFIGKVPTPFVLTDSNSSKYLPHMERSLVTAFQHGPALGFGLTHAQDTWAFKFVVKGDYRGANDGADGGKDGYSFIARGTWAPILLKDKLVHIGLSASYELKDGEKTEFFASEINKKSRFRNRAMANRTVDSSSGNFLFGADLASFMGPFSAEAEFVGVLAQVSDGDNQFYWGLNGGLGWFVTGQSREYKVKDGRFGKVKREKVGDWGVWELAARYSHLDLNNTTDGTRADDSTHQNITGTLNWYPTDHLKFSAEWVQNLKDEKGTIGMRVQTLF